MDPGLTLSVMTKNESDGQTEHKCCGILEEAATKSLERREKRREKPQPWIVLKTAVAITSAIIAYGFYVYIGRFCVPMIRDNDGALGGRKIGSECFRFSIYLCCDLNPACLSSTLFNCILFIGDNAMVDVYQGKSPTPPPTTLPQKAPGNFHRSRKGRRCL